MKGKAVFAYDPQTGEFVRPYPSCSQAEKETGAYRGAIAEAFQNNRKTPVGGYFWSFEKIDKLTVPEQVAHPAPTPKNGTPSRKLGHLNEAELRAKYDMSFIVRNYIKSFRPGDFVTEATLVEECKFRGMSNYRRVLDHPEWDKYKGKGGTIVYWGHPTKIAQLKEETVLS